MGAIRLNWFRKFEDPMHRCVRFFPLLAAVAFAAQAASQEAPPTPPPTQPAANRSVSSALPPAPVQTIKAKSNLVVVDVLVADPKQAPIHNLKASDFILLDNNAQQQITGFDEHSGPLPGQIAKAPAMRPLPPGIFTNFTQIPEAGAVNVLLLDALNTPMKDQAYVRDQLREFLKNTPQGVRVAIFGLNDRLIMLQGFTSDLATLRSAVEISKPQVSLTLPDNVGNGGTKAVSDMMSDVSGGAADMGQLLQSVQEFENVQGAVDAQIRVKQTLDAMNQIAHFLAGIPGRKNLIWFAGSFPLDIFPQPGAPRPFDVVSNSEDEFRETTNLLTRSEVSVYPIDARGVQTNAVAIGKDAGGSSFGAGLAQSQSTFAQDSADQHFIMDRMATDTGGQAYLDTNGLSAAVGKVIANGSNYYTLSYAPTNSTPDGKFHKIQVKLTQPGGTLNYRSGYFADETPSKPISSKIFVDLAGAGRAQGSQTAIAAGPNTLTRVMMRGAPNATEILLKLQVLPASNADEKAVVPGNIFNAEPAGKLKIKPPFRRYVIDIAADARDIHIAPTPDGHYQFSTEVITCVYDTNGVLINTAVQKAHGNLTASSYANMAHTGLPFHQEVSVPAAGTYFLRTSVHDLDTDRYGSVEIPVAKVANLAPLAAAPSAH